MRLAAINNDNDLLRLALSEAIPEPLLSRVIAASRNAPPPTQPGAIPNGLIDEAILGDLLYSGLMQARAAMSDLPPEVAKNQRVRDIMKRAEQMPGSLLDDANANWWLGLIGAFREAFHNPVTNRPIQPYQELAQQLRQQVSGEAGHWVQQTQARREAQAKQAEFKTQLDQLKQELQHQRKVQKLLDRYGYGAPRQGWGWGRGRDRGRGRSQRELGELTDIYGDLTDEERMFLLKQRMARRHQGATTMPANEATLVIATIAGLPITKEIVENLGSLKGKLGKFLDWLNPKRRAAMSQNYVMRSQNKLIAALAVKAAYDMAKDISERIRANQPPPRQPGSAKTTLRPSPQQTRLPRDTGHVPAP
jgi:hypothetical protein